MAHLEQSAVQARIEHILERMNGDLADSVFGMMAPRFHRLDLTRNELTLAFPGRHWERNGSGAVHGGIIGAMFDTAMGTLTYAITGSLTPTINLSVSYPRPAPLDGTLLVKVWITKLGRSVISVSGEICDTRAPKKVVCTASGTFRSFDEEHKREDFA